MKYLLFFIPLIIILYFLVKKWFAYHRAEKSGSVVYGPDHVISQTKNSLIDAARGYIAILAGGLVLVILSNPLTNFLGAFVMVVGYQYFMRALGIISELFGNKLESDKQNHLTKQ